MLVLWYHRTFQDSAAYTMNHTFEVGRAKEKENESDFEWCFSDCKTFYNVLRNLIQGIHSTEFIRLDCNWCNCAGRTIAGVVAVRAKVCEGDSVEHLS